MHIASLFKTAYMAMVANKIRTLLTILGMVIGIGSVIVVYSAGAGIEGLILGQIESFGSDIIETEIKVPSSKQGSENTSSEGTAALAQGAMITTLKIKDKEDIEKLPNVRDGYAAIMNQDKVTYGNESRKAFIMGVNASFIDVDKTKIETGRFFSDAEDRSLSRVVVLGSKMSEKLFGDSDPLEKSIQLHKSKYRVIGVMEERGAVMGMDFDDYVYLPIRTLQKRVMGIDYVLYMIHRLYDLDLSDQTADEMRSILRDNHDIAKPKVDDFGNEDYSKDDFRVVTMKEMMDMLETITGALTLLLLAIVAISLIVGGVGIMNIMYVVVSERTKEIGLRKAVGANTSDIMWQFLIESVLITVAGGIFGIIFGVLISFLLAHVAGNYGFEWDFVIPLEAFFVAIGFSGFFGIAFGIYPARKAAKLDPIEALRNE